MCGVEVIEYDSLPPGVQNRLEWVTPEIKGSSSSVARTWADILVSHGAEVVARYTDDYYAGQPAITCNRYGEGSAIYIGTIGDAATHRALVNWLLSQTGVATPIEAPTGVEVTVRSSGAQRLLFILNHTTTPQLVTLDKPYRDLLGNPANRVEGALTVDRYEVAILEEAM
jgi:beta-galactosidase